MNGNWKLVKIANGHLSCENLSLEASDIPNTEKIIENRFGEGILRRKNILVSWDCWSGVFIMIMPNGANEESMSASDEFIKEIYELLKKSY